MDLGGGLIVSDALTGLSADVRVRMLLVHQDQGFRDRGVSLSFGYNSTPSTPLGFMAKLTPSWGGQATSGAQALWGRETMAGVADGGPAAGGRLEAELGYGMPVGGRLVGMSSFGIGASGHGRDYRLGYGLTVAQGGAMHFDLGVYANRRESLGPGAGLWPQPLRRAGCRRKNADPMQQEDWPNQFDWMVSTLEGFDKTFRARLKSLDSQSW